MHNFNNCLWLKDPANIYKHRQWKTNQAYRFRYSQKAQATSKLTRKINTVRDATPASYISSKTDNSNCGINREPSYLHSTSSQKRPHKTRQKKWIIKKGKRRKPREVRDGNLDREASSLLPCLCLFANSEKSTYLNVYFFGPNAELYVSCLKTSLDFITIHLIRA